MNLKYFLGFLFFTCCSSLYSSAQDPEFSQFYAAPAHLNPAMLGFSPKPRLVLNYRHQMPSFGNAFLTLGASYDQHFNQLNSSFGVSILADRTAGGLYNSYFVNGAYAYQLGLSDNLLLKVGVQVSYLQQNMDWVNLVFGDMINPITGEVVVPTFEGAPERTNIHKIDFGGGLVAYTDKFYIGASVKHVTRPSLAFSAIPDSDNRLGVRSSFHIGNVFYLGKDKQFKPRFYVSPNLLFVSQNRFFQLNTGLYAGKGMIFGGLWYRHTFGNADALITSLGVKVNMIKIGYSHDFNLTALDTGAGAHELSISFDLGDNNSVRKNQRKQKNYQCPEIFRQ